MQNLYKLKQTLMDELETYAAKNQMTSQDLAKVDTLCHACKNLCKIIEECDKDEYSGRMSRKSYYDDGMSYDEGEMYVRPDGTYARRSMKRDGMGRYARSSGDVVGQLKDMMYGADERTRSEIQKLISKLEK